MPPKLTPQVPGATAETVTTVDGVADQSGHVTNDLSTPELLEAARKDLESDRHALNQERAQFEADKARLDQAAADLAEAEKRFQSKRTADKPGKTAKADQSSQARAGKAELTEKGWIVQE